MAGENDIHSSLQWDLVDRLNKSLRISGLSVQQMADFLECHRNSVGGWLNDRNTPNPATLMMWAQITGVPYEWLRNGTEVTAELPISERLRQTSAGLAQIADQLERSDSP